ncbi:MAG: histidine ammonia-lyase [Deltaproteobacteria bacterium]
MAFAIDGTNLTLKKFENIVRDDLSVSLSPVSQSKMNDSLRFLEEKLKKNEIIYGVNTGFGALCDVRILPAEMKSLQLNLIRSHSAGVGEFLEPREVRAILLLRAHALSRGYSAVRPLVVKKLIELLNKNVLPLIPSKGSVGASGDLAPLAHLALVLVGEGEALYQGARMSGKRALALSKTTPIELTGREGLAAINGTQMMEAISAINVLKAETLFRLFDIASALSLESIQGSRLPFDRDLHNLRPHRGQKTVAEKLWKLTANSDIQKHHKNCDRVQDPYSFRCIPQVHGSSRDALAFVRQIIETELSSVTDNPLFFARKKKWVHGGNFHGQYLSQAMDFLSIAATTIVNISERRIEKLLDPKFSGHTAFLAPREGINSGLMGPHYTAAALASENKVLAHPSSVDTIPTCCHKEDHVSMGPHAALKAKEILKNAESVLAIEFLAASQGIEYQRPLKTSPLLEKVMATIRKHVEPIHKDRVFSHDIEKLKTIFPLIDEVTKRELL